MNAATDTPIAARPGASSERAANTPATNDPNKNRRPYPAAAQQEESQRQPGRRPQYGGGRIDPGEYQFGSGEAGITGDDSENFERIGTALGTPRRAECPA